MSHKHDFKKTSREILAEWSKGNWPEQCRFRIDGFLAICDCGRGAIIPREPRYRTVELEDFTLSLGSELPVDACSLDPALLLPHAPEEQSSSQAMPG